MTLEDTGHEDAFRASAHYSALASLISADPAWSQRPRDLAAWGGLIDCADHASKRMNAIADAYFAAKGHPRA